MANYIPYPYKSADKKLINAIEEARKNLQGDSDFLPEWWMCGSTFCTQKNNGYYHVYTPEKSPFYGKILADYRIDKHGKMIDTGNFYRIPNKEDLLKWCAERNIEIKM